MKFMNSLCDKIENSENFGDEIYINPSKKNFKFRVSFGVDEKFHRMCVIEIELFQDQNDAYLLKFLRRRGEFSDYEKIS